MEEIEVIEIEGEEETKMENGKKGFWKKVVLGAAGVVGGIFVLGKVFGRKSSGDEDSISDSEMPYDETEAE